jgi:hypothetical protein
MVARDIERTERLRVEMENFVEAALRRWSPALELIKQTADKYPDKVYVETPGGSIRFGSTKKGAHHAYSLQTSSYPGQEFRIGSSGFRHVALGETVESIMPKLIEILATLIR